MGPVGAHGSQGPPPRSSGVPMGPRGTPLLLRGRPWAHHGIPMAHWNRPWVLLVRLDSSDMQIPEEVNMFL